MLKHITLFNQPVRETTLTHFTMAPWFTTLDKIQTISVG